MNNIWDQTIQIDQDIAYLVSKELIFRFPRREKSILLIQKEIALLPDLAQHLPFAISNPQYIGKPITEYPYYNSM